MEVLKYRNSVPRINQIKFRTILMELHGSQNPDPNLTLDLLFLCLKNGRGWDAPHLRWGLAVGRVYCASFITHSHCTECQCLSPVSKCDSSALHKPRSIGWWKQLSIYCCLNYLFLDRGQATSPSCRQPTSFHCLRVSNFHIYWLQLELQTLNNYVKCCWRSSFLLFLSLDHRNDVFFCSALLNIPFLHVCVKCVLWSSF